MAKSEALEKLVPHINSLENIQQNLKQTKEEAAAQEIVLRTEIMKLRDANRELHSSVGSKESTLSFAFHSVYSVSSCPWYCR